MSDLISDLGAMNNVDNKKLGNQLQSEELLGDFNTFIKLLTVQLENQDPLNPMESADFTNQIVSFSIANQSLQTNNYLSKLVDLQESTRDSIDNINSSANQLSSLMHFIGKDITADGSRFNSTNDSNKSFFFSLPREIPFATVEISNSEGDVVYSKQLEDVVEGFHSISWDGKDKDGKDISSTDVFKLNVYSSSFVDGEQADFNISGQVQSISMFNNKPMLVVDGVLIHPTQLVVLSS